jgi:predicted dehydrogenase
MKKIGIIGLGFMGKMHLGVYGKHSKAKVVAFSDDRKEILSGKIDDIGGNIEGSEETSLNLKETKPYKNPDDLINDSEVEVVDICLPTYLHHEYTIKAIKAGKHVFCEKPMAFSLDQADDMIKTAKESGKYFMVGQCIRFWPEYTVLKDIIDNNTLGKIKSLVCRRYSPRPAYSWENWLLNPGRSSGAALDLHIHDTDFLVYLFGKPQAVNSQAIKDNSGLAHITTQYYYSNIEHCVAEGGWHFTDKYPFNMAFTAIFEKGEVEFDLSKDPAFRVYEEGKDPYTPDVPEGDGYSREIDYFLNCLENNIPLEIVTPESAKLSLEVIMAEKESVEKKRKISL